MTDEWSHKFNNIISNWREKERERWFLSGFHVFFSIILAVHDDDFHSIISFSAMMCACTCVCVYARISKCGRSDEIQNSIIHMRHTYKHWWLTRFSLNILSCGVVVYDCVKTHLYWLGSMKWNFLGCQLHFGIMNHVNVLHVYCAVWCMCKWTRKLISFANFSFAKYHHFRWYTSASWSIVRIDVRAHRFLCFMKY